MTDICILGMGYIGLPTAVMLAESGCRVLGVDTNPLVREALGRGEPHIEEPGLRDRLKAVVEAGTLRASATPEPADVFIIAVPTPLTADKRADMRHVAAAAEALTPFLRPGSLVILESTSPPGTCAELLRPILEAGGRRVGEDVFLAHCPERVLPGRIFEELVENDRVIGGVDPHAAERARDLYARFVKGDIFLTDATTAEMVKLIENTFRDVNIALANETAVLCEAMGIDFWSVMGLANRHPRVGLHRAGPGVGGHCISVDPWFLVERFSGSTPLIALARRVNDAMPAHVADRVMAMLAGVTQPVVALFGLAYKGNVDDLRESPSLTLARLLGERGCEVRAHDPFAQRAPLPNLPPEACLDGADLLLVATAHSAFAELDPMVAAARMRGRRVYDAHRLLPADRWVAAGFAVEVLGVG